MWLTKLPLIGDIVGKAFDRLWPDKTKYAEKVLDLEMEEMKQNPGLISPRMLLKYMVVLFMALFVFMSIMEFFFPDVPALPFTFTDLVQLAGLLFGFGG